ncbi:MAG TPA: YceI family protein [Cytophagaceae bacterium]|jgi:polyisoprenoid-binding protein YceI|nr:YceI family protein [Cytophagaceae bacterium]
MKKKIFLINLFLLLIHFATQAQGKYKISESNLSFFSHASLENIEAKSKMTQGIIDFDTKSFIIKIPIKSFRFKSSLMEDHFNENYMESEKYPYALLKGTIMNNYDLTKDGKYQVSIVGDLNVHGVTQNRTIAATLDVKKGVITVTSIFNIKLVDHKIEIPTIVFQKIAEVIEVTFDGVLQKM